MGSIVFPILIPVLIAWLAGFVLLWKIPVCGKATNAQGELSIIIPARNEESSLPRLLESIRSQDWQPTEIIVVDDGSTDRTAQIARELGASVVQPAPPPSGWLGKPWACQSGAKAATSTHLLFLDADTWFEPGGLQRIWSCYQQRPGVLSVLPFHRVPTAGENLSAFFNLVMAAGVGAFTAFPNRHAGLFGQMMLIDRDTYQQLGGHESVRGDRLENLAFANLISRRISLHCAAGRGVLSMRMYPGGVKELVGGWSRGFASGAGATPLPILALVIVWLIGSMLAASELIRLRVDGVITYLLYVAQFFWLLRQIGSFNLLTAIFYPVPLIFFFIVFGLSLVRRRTATWKGRTILAD
jgi:4,4'-diaponeurosporenoate glycosyltransferase